MSAKDIMEIEFVSVFNKALNEENALPVLELVYNAEPSKQREIVTRLVQELGKEAQDERGKKGQELAVEALTSLIRDDRIQANVFTEATLLLMEYFYGATTSLTMKKEKP